MVKEIIRMLAQLRLLSALAVVSQVTGMSATVAAPVISQAPELVPLPRKCGSGLPPGAATPVCCLSGYVFVDGQAIANAEVTITNGRTGGSLTTATAEGSDSNVPYYGVDLSEPPLDAAPGDTLTISFRYAGGATTLQHRVLEGGQQIDGVMPAVGTARSLFERQLREPMAPGAMDLQRGDVALDDTGMLYVADYGNARVQVFTPDGRLNRQWGTFGSGPGQMATPSGIAVDGLKTVYVTDYEGHAVHLFTIAGTWVATWHATNGRPFRYPTDVAVDADGFVYVVDGESRVQKYSSDGSKVAEWGSAAGAGQLDGAWGIDIGPDGLLYVADANNKRVVIFTATGTFVRAWDGVGTAAGPLSLPRRVAVGADGRVAVSDKGNDRVVVFSAAGAFIQQWSMADSRDQREPEGIAIDGAGTVYVISDANNTATGDDRIQVFSPVGALVRQWGGTSYPPNRIKEPVGMARDAAGNLYISDRSMSVVRKYNAAGTHIADLGVPFSSDADGLYFPHGIATNGTSELYIVDAGNSRIQVFSLDGAPLDRWGTFGTGPGQFDAPYGIARDSAGNVYVTDVNNNRIQKFTSQGGYLWDQGGPAAGTALGQFNFPVGVAVSPDGTTLYVSDTLNHRIQRLHADSGVPIDAFGSYGDGPGELATPSGISVAPDGTLLVAEFDNYRIQRFSPDGVPVAIYGAAGISSGLFNQPTHVIPGPDGRLIVIERYLGRVQFLRLTGSAFTRPIATIVAAGPLVATVGEPVRLHGRGADSDTSNQIADYTWTLDGTTVATTAEATLATADLAPGTYTLGFQVRDTEGELSEMQTVTLRLIARRADDPVGAKRWTFLLYLAGDNTGVDPHLNPNSRIGALYRLLNTTSNAHVTVAALYDGNTPQGGDTLRYLLRPGQEPLIEARPEANMGDVQTFVEFVRWGLDAAPYDATYLAIANHGNALDGTAWDFTSNPNRSERITPIELQQALAEITDGGARPIDVLHLDSCLMGLVEIAYQVRVHAHYLIASQSLAWSAFAYDRYRQLVEATTTPRQLATGIVDHYAQIVGDAELPYTIAAIDLAQLAPLTDALNSLSGKLLGYAQASASNRATLASVRAQTQLLDSSGNGQLDASDEYIDLGHWLTRIEQSISDASVQAAAAQVRGLLPTTVIREAHLSGKIRGVSVNLDGATGLGIYYPPAPGARTAQTYRVNLRFAQDTLWDELLQAGLAALSPIDDPGPNPVPPLPFELYPALQIFLPIVRQ